MLEVDVTLDELADILGEELELPTSRTRARARSSAPRTATPASAASAPSRCATSSAPTARRCKRSIASGTYNPAEPIVVPHHDDKRYRSLEDEHRAGRQRRHHLHDGRLGLDGRRAEGDRPHRVLLDRYLAAPQYKGLESRFIIHDAVAREVDRDTFFHTRESGGTMISSAYKLCAQIIDAALPGRRVEHLPVPLLRRRQLVDGRHAVLRRDPEEEDPAEGEHVRLRPGREPVRLGPVHQGPCASTSATTSASSRARSATRTPSSAASRTSSARGSRCLASSRSRPTLPRYLRDEQERIEKIARELRARLLPDRLRDADLRPDERDRRVRRLSRAAIRTGASAWSTSSSARATSTASRRSTRWSSTTTPRTPTCSRATASPIRSS